jgi:peptidoglycan LD-endopeptidase CwlK
MAIKLADKTPTLQALLDRADKKLAGVHPTLKTKAIELIKRAYTQGINVLITQGYRSIDEQNELYAQGRTKPGKIVTNAKGGYSYHNFGLAFDIVIQNADGSLCWSVADKRWKTVGAIGKSLGLEWGGDWRKFPDYPHFQLTFGLSLADLRAGKRPPQPQVHSTQSQVNPQANSAQSSQYPLPNEILKRGSRGEAVKQLQRALNAARFKCGQVDGIYGAKTEDAVRRFQMVYSPYEVDGIYGPKTKAKLAEVLQGGGK